MSSDISKPGESDETEEDQAVGLKLVDAASKSGTSTDTASPNASKSTLRAAPTHRRSDRRRLPVWLFAVVLLLFSLVVGWQAQVAGELEAEVAGLEARLERTNALLGAHRAHLSEIRGGVRELSERLQGLRTLVDRDPTAVER